MTCDNYFIKETIPKFILTVELSDFSGSIRATAFDELGKMLFKEMDL